MYWPADPKVSRPSELFSIAWSVERALSKRGRGGGSYTYLFVAFLKPTLILGTNFSKSIPIFGAKS